LRAAGGEPPLKSRRSIVLSLGAAQTLAWASSFYLPAMLAAPMARDLGTTPSRVYAALSMALLVSALVSPWAGRRIDRLGGRPMLLGSVALFVLALALLALARGPVTMFLAWAVMGCAMGTGLYDAAFASLVRLFGADARRSISGITLLGGFASTVGWPLTAWMEVHWGWRGACWGWVALHLAVGLPLNLWLPTVDRDAPAATPVPLSARPPSPPPAAPMTTAAATRHMVLLATLFALMGFVSTSVASHLPTLLQAAGAPLATAVALAALAGPSQVAARVLELGWLSRFSPLLAARLASLGHPLGAACVLAGGAAAALPFVVLHGLGNGLLTIVRGTLPLALFGAQGYGTRQGLIALPGRLLGALSPWLLGLAMAHWGAGALWLTAGCGVASLALLSLLRLPAAAPAAIGADATSSQNRA
jgi:predicted MFS family arabinose efflux permease